MSIRSLIIAASMLLGAAASAQTPSAGPVPTPPTQPTVQTAAPAVTVTPAATAPKSEPAITAEDLGAFYDGMLPWALARGDIAGAVVVVVKDGQPLFARGYGYSDVATRTPVDPAATLFRPGSVSKLFTWTAVMQMVEQGKLDLDKDVNGYIDFKIPEAFGKPITLRNIMTHSAGFQEQLKGIMLTGSPTLPTLGDFLKESIPSRVYEPGKVIAYSNYATALAGYIVERASGKPFEQYLEDHIYTPLQMTRSTMRQPLPANLEPLMSKGYKVASAPPSPFEVIGPWPAGSMSAPGLDMGKFMVAFLSGGGPLLKPETVKQMHTLTKAPGEGINGMALGFYEETRNGHRIVGHGGDTEVFHSDLHLLVNDNIGIFVSFNSAGKEGVTSPLRTQILRGFLDRYYPAPIPQEPATATAAEHGAAIAGSWKASRGAGTSWLKLSGALGPVKAALNPDNTVTFAALTDAAGTPRVWREVAPWRWREVNGPAMLAANLDASGRPVELTTDDFPAVMIFQRAPFELSAAALPLIGLALVTLLVTVLAWPIAAVVRRHYAQPAKFTGRDLQLYRGSRLAALVQFVFLGGWLFLLTRIGAGLAMFQNGFDPVLRLLQLIGLIGIAGTILVLYRTWGIFRDPRFGIWGKVSNVLLALACLVVVWAAFSYNLLTFGMQY